jgi:hypothetical protein
MRIEGNNPKRIIYSLKTLQLKQPFFFKCKKYECKIIIFAMHLLTN